MSRPRLSHKEQNFFLYWFLRCYEFLASLKLAVILILTWAIVLGFATFIESEFGSQGVHWYVYGTNWFIGLQALLGLNIFCAAAIRFPWTRQQTGFVVTHIGLLILLFGSAVSFRDNLDLQLRVLKGSHNSDAWKPELSYLRLNNLPGTETTVVREFHPGPFNWYEQPFKRFWMKLMYRYSFTRGWMTWLGYQRNPDLIEHPPETIFENDQVKVEVIDFYASAQPRGFPYVKLQFYQSLIGQEMPVDLEYESYKVGDNTVSYGSADFFNKMGNLYLLKTEDEEELKRFQEAIPDRTVKGMGTVVIASQGEIYSLPVSELISQTEPFELESGQSVELIDVDEEYRPLFGRKFLTQFPWVNVKAKITFGRPIPWGPRIVLKITQSDGSKEELELFSDFPMLNRNDKQQTLRADYYHPTTKPRVTLMAGPNQQLAYRVWQQKQGRIVAQGMWNLIRDPVTGLLRSTDLIDTWSMGGKMASGESAAWQMSLETYLPLGEGAKETILKTISRNENSEETNEEGKLIQTHSQFRGPVPLPFNKQSRGEMKYARVRVNKKTMKGGFSPVDTFWLPLSLSESDPYGGTRVVHETEIIGAEKKIQTQLTPKEADVGFEVKLVDFELDLDPGSRMAGNYTSHIVIVDVRKDKKLSELKQECSKLKGSAKKEKLREYQQREDVLVKEKLDKLAKVERRGPTLYNLVDADGMLSYHVITMNKPLDYPDLDGRSLRLFQENYDPPKKNGRPEMSVFRVNYDPGRPWKYLGSVLVSLGIVIMFYMRAYFFKSVSLGKKKRLATQQRETTENQSQAESSSSEPEQPTAPVR